METLSSEREAQERGEGGLVKGTQAMTRGKLINASYFEGLGFNTRRLWRSNESGLFLYFIYGVTTECLMRGSLCF